MEQADCGVKGAGQHGVDLARHARHAVSVRRQRVQHLRRRAGRAWQRLRHVRWPPVDDRQRCKAAARSSSRPAPPTAPLTRPHPTSAARLHGARVQHIHGAIKAAGHQVAAVEASIQASHREHVAVVGWGGTQRGTGRETGRLNACEEAGGASGACGGGSSGTCSSGKAARSRCVGPAQLPARQPRARTWGWRR